MLTIDKLKEYGANIEEGLERCMGNEAFYLKMVGMMIADNSIDKLKDALAENNLDTAFEAAHALKGVAANLSLTPLTEPAVEITELLRTRTEMDYSELLGKILEQKEILESMAEQLLARKMPMRERVAFYAQK